MTDRAVREEPATMSHPDGSPGSAVPRAPFADNPAVGERGQQAQQRILDAALQVFGELGYHQCRVQRITEVAGCSRVSFYQYFSSKEDLFRHLAGRVARLLGELVDGLEPITPDAAGHATIMRYFDEYAVIYNEYRPVFVTFQTAASSDVVMAEGGHRIAVRSLEHLQRKVIGSPLAPDQLTGTVRTMIETASRANRIHDLLEEGSPPVNMTRKRLHQALADINHRALFGVVTGLNLRTPARRQRAIPMESQADAAPAAKGKGKKASAPGPGGLLTRAAVLEAGHQVYVERGYYGTRVDDIVSVAGVSHGVFYRYFRNKDELFRLLAAQAGTRFAAAYDELGQLDLAAPDVRTRFRAWLDHYAATCAESAAILRVWVDAITRDPQLGSDSAAGVRTGCRGILRLLEQRGSGDVEAEAIVVIVLLEAMTSGAPSARRVARVGGVLE